MNSNSFKTHKYVRVSRMYKPKERLIRFPSFSLLGGSRSDPLNLNELIRNKQETTTNDGTQQMEIHHTDRLIDILIPPDVYDPLDLDKSLYNNENSIALNSDNQYSMSATSQGSSQRKQPRFYDQLVPRAAPCQCRY